MNRILAAIVPFIFIGIVLVLVAVGMIVFSWVLFFGIITGLVLYLIAWVRATFFAAKQSPMQKPHQGRIIDMDNNDMDK